MYEGLRLTELHEEWAYSSFNARSESFIGTPENAARLQAKADSLDAEIRAQVAAQEIGIPFLVPGFSLDVARQNFPVPLAFGIPDAERVYPAKRRTSADGGLPEPREGWIAMTTAFPFDHWANHAAHFLPVKGCHLCRERPHV